jgi:hypothetical protein
MSVNLLAKVLFISELTDNFQSLRLGYKYSHAETKPHSKVQRNATKLNTRWGAIGLTKVNKT